MLTKPAISGPKHGLCTHVRGRLAAFRRTHAWIPCKILRRAIHRLESANSVIKLAVFWDSPRNETFAKPNWRLMTRNGYPTLARMLALRFKFLKIYAHGTGLVQRPALAKAHGSVPVDLNVLSLLAFGHGLVSRHRRTHPFLLHGATGGLV